MVGMRSTGVVRKKHALQLFKTDICKFFLQGRCENGDMCAYAHKPDEVRHKPDLTRTSMCKSVAQGKVCNDRMCAFAHSELQLRATHGFFKMKMCSFVESGRCKHGSECRFAHSPDELRPAKPPVPGSNDEMLLARQHQAANARVDQSGNKYIFGMLAKDQNSCINAVLTPEIQAQTQEVPPPPLMQTGPAEAMQARRIQWREAQESVTGGRPPGAASQNTGGNESDNSDQPDSWGGSCNSSGATEIPRSEHTEKGSSRNSQTFSDDSGKKDGAGSPAPTGSSTSAGGAGSGSSEDHTHMQNVQRQPQNVQRQPRTGVTGGTFPRVTTLMICNIPTYLTQGALLSMFEDLTTDMRGKFDFFYCPWDEKGRLNLGYALVNFLHMKSAAEFQQRWQNKGLCGGSRGQKTLRIMKAALQGLQANIEYFSKVEIAECSDSRFRPLFRESTGQLSPLELDKAEDAADTPVMPDSPPQRMRHAERPTSFGEQQDAIPIDLPQLVNAGPVNSGQSPQTQWQPRRTHRQTDVNHIPGRSAQSARQRSYNAIQLAYQMPFDIYVQQVQEPTLPVAHQDGGRAQDLQQPQTWPVMMTPMQWPGGERLPQESEAFIAPSATQSFVPQGHGQVPYMMMPMEALMPVDPPCNMSMPCGWKFPVDEVYSD